MGNFYGHIHLDVRGALKNMTRRELAAMFTESSTGRKLNADEAKDVLLDHLEAGHKVIPLGPACEGFDYAGGGCPGHEEQSDG
ncbi:TPA: hypothetical protein UN285_000374 [Stenotrophomonas maltophilia]|jgi:hypothetical protein|uniref:hypothetical protein n=1 Tax=Stenotrophomonas TaxID=40323 RepID=UPI000C15BAE6|nr:hypothetical protein [Stenotrophomonas maltophilia]EKU9979129.1 hypothetical protein [Stenotrophomonas maltophilia]EKX6270998.1 hypothetical protein [Stenotrophomonas maltophilia]MBS6053992.1 hypothetical protein [Stenotrophomonas maltophilia]MDG9766118.1 hypothetical protein [Stenotrophomonas maltophilia]MDG9910350.1 hypothetical protein [Stenotrophomonas maltophilia]